MIYTTPRLKAAPASSNRPDPASCTCSDHAAGASRSTAATCGCRPPPGSVTDRATSSAVGGTLQLIKEVKNVGQLRNFQAWPGITHSNDSLRASRVRGDPDAASGIGKFRGISKEIGHNLRQPHGISVDSERFPRVRHHKVLAPGINGCSVPLYRLIDYGGDFNPLDIQAELSKRHPRPIEQVIQQTHYRLHLAVDRVANLAELGLAGSHELQHVNRIADERQRTSKLVRKYPDKFVLTEIGIAQLRPGYLQCVLGALHLSNVASAGYGTYDSAGGRPDRIRVYQNVHSCAVWLHHHQFLVAYRLATS